jgi:hypothetical protein
MRKKQESDDRINSTRSIEDVERHVDRAVCVRVGGDLADAERKLQATI